MNQPTSSGSLIERGGFVQAAAEVAEKMNIKTGDNVAVRRRLRTVDGMPWNINDSYYPLDVVMGTRVLDPADVSEGVITYLAQLGYEQKDYSDELTWRMPTPDEAQRLQIGPGVSVLIQMRTAYTDERPIRVTVNVSPGDRHRMVYELPA